MSKFYQIGEILKNGQIKKGASSQGMIYKSLEAFINKTGICYVPENSDTEYTYTDFYNLVNENEKLARILFDMVDWQHPEVKLDELINDDEINICINCKNTYESYEINKCPHCGQLKVLDSFNKDNVDIFIFSINDNEYEVNVYTDLMKKMNWSWESLIFANNLDTFATVLDKSNNETSILNTNGEVKIYDLTNDTELSKNDIIKLALSGEIDNFDKYSIDANNWFGVDFMKDSSLLEDIVFEATPTTSLGVATEMIKFHLNYFCENSYNI